jgi:hypothetical protein
MPLRYICKKCSFPGRLYIPRDQDVRGGVLVLHGSEGGGRSFAGFRWCTAQTVALYFTLSGVGNFRSGSAGLDSSKGNLRARFPGRVLIIVSVQGCQIASKSDPFSLARATPSEGAKTGVAEPHIAEQSRSWRGASGERGVKRGS